jgi:hypothetical protein
MLLQVRLVAGLAAKIGTVSSTHLGNYPPMRCRLILLNLFVLANTGPVAAPIANRQSPIANRLQSLRAANFTDKCVACHG